MINTKIGVLYISLAVVSFGSSTAFLKLSISRENANTARLIRAVTQTMLIVGAFWLCSNIDFYNLSKQGLWFPVWNGGLSGFAFIYFSKGLKTVPANIAKPILSFKLIIAVSLAFLILREPLTITKGAGILSALLAIFFLTIEADSSS